MQNSLFKLFEHKCVLEVCVHIHLIMIKIHPVVFLKSPFSNQAVLRFLSEWRSSAQTALTIVDCLTLDPHWVSCYPSAIESTPVQGKTRMSLIKRLRCFVFGCNNEHSSRQLLPTSELLKSQRINVTFALKWMHRSPICLHASMHSRSEYKVFFMNLCKASFLITC